MTIQWYPGHMKKTRDLIGDHLKLVDLVVELVDARAPLATTNPIFDELLGTKKRLMVLNKSDLADPSANEAWKNWYKTQGKGVLLYNAKSDSPKVLIQAIQQNARFVHEKNVARGQSKRAIRVMVIGIPNVGKSSLINRLVGKHTARTGNRPGVTRGKQWIRLQGDVDLFDTPGILWPKFEDQEQAMKIALLGSINDLILNEEAMALQLLEFLEEHYPGALFDRYGVESTAHEALEDIGRRRGCLLSGAQVDQARSAMIVLEDFRAGRLGRISLETPDAE